MKTLAQLQIDLYGKRSGRTVKRTVAGCRYLAKWAWSKWYASHVAATMAALGRYPRRSDDSLIIDVARCLVEHRHGIALANVAKLSRPQERWVEVTLRDGTAFNLLCCPTSRARFPYTLDCFKDNPTGLPRPISALAA